MIVLAFMTVFGVSSSQAQAFVGESNFDTPLPPLTLHACNGEPVDFSGRIHNTFHLTITPSGNFHNSFFFNYQDVQGTGEITGIDYRLTGVQRFALISNQPQFEFTFVLDTHIVGEGPADNSKVSIFQHVVLNANGQVTASIFDVKVTCH